MFDNITSEDFDVFREALTEEQLELQIVLVQKLQPLAKAIGPTATTQELLPLIEDHFLEFHNEVLFNLAEQLAGFLSLVGDPKPPLLFEILGKLCFTDETLVREKAVEALIEMQVKLTSEEVEELLVPVVDRLVKDDWFTSKCSAVMLYSPLYSKVSQQRKSEIRNSLKTLIQDDSPMVRKAAAKACVDFAAVVEDEFLKTDFVLVFQDIALDPMDSVRTCCIDLALALIERLGQEELDPIFKTIEATSDDASWRLRQNLANNLQRIQQAIPHGKYRGKILAIFQKLCQDMDSGVRLLTATNLFPYCQQLLSSYSQEQHNNFEAVFEQSIMSSIQKLAIDDNEEVRLALSSNVLPLSGILSSKCFETNLVPFVSQILDNEESVVIQANFLSSMSSLQINLAQWLGLVENVTRAVIARSSSNWRSRRTILATFLDIAKHCDADYFNRHFKNYYALLLGDSVCAIRQSAALILPLLAKHYGMKWASQHLVPHFISYKTDSRYLYRFVTLFGISQMVAPSLVKQGLYMEGYKKLLSEEGELYRPTLISLGKVVKTSFLIRTLLKEDEFVLMLQQEQECTPAVYHLDELQHLQDVDLYSIATEDLLPDHYTYLHGLLSIIYNRFLTSLQLLYKDITHNVKVRSIDCLREICQFMERLHQEENQEWVQEATKKLTSEELRAINEDIHLEFKLATSKVDDLKKEQEVQEVIAAEHEPND